MLTAILRLFSAGCTSVKGKIWVIYRKFSGKLPVIYGNGNIPNLTGNFRTLLLLLLLSTVSSSNEYRVVVVLVVVTQVLFDCSSVVYTVS